MASLVTVVGNPKAGSRTLAVASGLADGIAASFGEIDRHTYDLAELGPGLLAPWTLSPEAKDAVAQVREATVLVLATPTYKGSFTGLLKLLLDTLPAGSLDHTVTVPVVLSAGPAHRHLADLQLAAVLSELGAVRPVPSLLVQESEIDAVDATVAEWVGQHAAVLQATVAALAQP
ncbi:NADPH-dependent oxidoreductase [Nakamurella sp. YIM 132087]|uniref:NADPH-dependent oxidoreductase n=1 Tax=Nakamurella alba TaxID=2665158 RepID=A0A7K1FPP1_9ACTN|nr:NAD(P)H-dependent oxidoreductase [Nakamurella alba]MTD16115.1 NADPH-dependent oxidoreductase [Nakamurella alba]